MRNTHDATQRLIFFFFVPPRSAPRRTTGIARQGGFRGDRGGEGRWTPNYARGAAAIPPARYVSDIIPRESGNSAGVVYAGESASTTLSGAAKTNVKSLTADFGTHTHTPRPISGTSHSTCTRANTHTLLYFCTNERVYYYTRLNTASQPLFVYPSAKTVSTTSPSIICTYRYILFVTSGEQ